MPSTEKDTEIRGVVVIKSKPKSKAKEKKQALALWKRVGKRTVQELRRVGGSAADVRKRYNLFRSKQPTARLRNGKIVLEWNPVSTPVYAQQPAEAPKPPGLKKSSGMNGDFNELLSQVQSASGIDVPRGDENAKVTNIYLNVPTSVNMGPPNHMGKSTAVNHAGQNAATNPSGNNTPLYPVLQNTEKYPNGQKTEMYPTGQNIAMGPSGQNPAHQGTPNPSAHANGQNTAYQSTPNPSAHANGQNTAYQTAQNTPGYPNGQNQVYQIVQNTASFQNGNPAYQATQNTSCYPNGQNLQNSAGYSNVQNSAFNQAGSNTAIYHTGQNGAVYSSGYNNLAYQAGLPQYGECISRQTAYTNLAFEGDNNVSNNNPGFHQGNIETNLSGYESGKRENTQNYLNDPNSQLATVDTGAPQTNSGNFGAHAFPNGDDGGICFNVHTRIISSKVTKVHVPRSKDLPSKQDCSESSSDNVAKKGAYGKKKKGIGKFSNLPYRAKHKKRRKKNQVAFEERITLDAAPDDFPVRMETTIEKSKTNPPATKTNQYPLFYSKIEDEQ